MGHAQLVEQKMTVEEYFELEKRSEIRHEYYNGEVYAMAGTTLNHNRIVGKVRNLLGSHFLSKRCDVFSENVKVEVSSVYYPYPDVVVTCAPSDISGTYIIRHPTVLVEVMSKTSEHCDSIFKLKQYKIIPSLQYYLLVSQYDYNVSLYSRLERTDLWTYHTFSNSEDVVRLEAFDFEMSLQSIYENIEFVPEE
ncbi:MAG: Uma2 family endonuclease [Dyadobacter sp.]|uniref:Uma2 family endonuclease n=1 Tax=Dyadobacter sp. TaxID=1914288 RepID=UPI001B15A0B2|nr:Uma2 family endonuclease [Dyadobacter sp.]MBO9617284.1 Uma2 family endonuclease [Dyadobacter sp.]